MAPSLLLLLIKDNDQSSTLTAHSITQSFGKLCNLLIKMFLIMMRSASIVKWVTESNRPANIVNDAKLQNIMTAGRPHTIIPSVSTVSQDINALFAKCHDKIGKMLKVSAKLSLFSGAINRF